MVLHIPQMVTTPNYNWSERMLEKTKIPNLMSQDVPSMPPDYYTCLFRTNKLERYVKIQLSSCCHSSHTKLFVFPQLNIFLKQLNNMTSLDFPSKTLVQF